jgi:uncharacterized membrane protein
MNQFIVVVFPDETGAQAGARVLQDLHARGDLSLYSLAIISTSPDGKVSQSKLPGKEPMRAAVGAVVGALIGLLAGPIGAAIGFASGGFIGLSRDLAKVGAGEAFLNEIHQKLTPGTSAVVAEIAEEGMSSLDTQMEAIGGVVLRELRIDAEDERVEKEAAIRRAHLAQLKAGAGQVAVENKPELLRRIDAAQRTLTNTAARLDSQLDDIRTESEQKTLTLREQGKQLTDDAKARVEERIASLGAELDQRTTKLHKAAQLTKEALRS